MTTALGSIARLEHVNLLIPDQQTATLFYVVGLGLTRDPVMMVGLNNMWINIGRSQMHLPTHEQPQRLRGVITLTIPDIETTVARLDSIRAPLQGTSFRFTQRDGEIAVTCPWGNHFRIIAPDPAVSPVELGLSEVCFDIPVGTAGGVARFYQDIVETRAGLIAQTGNAAAAVPAGPGQVLVFQETTEPLPDFDGHHIQIYVGAFDQLRRRMTERGLISADDGPHQFRFTDIIDPDSGDLLYQVEHEVRSLDHPLFARPLFNRNPGQTLPAFKSGRDLFSGTI